MIYNVGCSNNIELDGVSDGWRFVASQNRTIGAFSLGPWLVLFRHSLAASTA
jgi:hypothetical protein